MSGYLSAAQSSNSKVFVYGPPGSGKSSIAVKLARVLNLPVYDLDELIVERTGISIPEIFANEGEAGFRVYESDALETLLGGGRAVVALGGGALLNSDNRRMVEEAGSVLCLQASLETIIQRMEADQNQRPLFGEDDPQRINQLLSERETHYRSFPLKLETDGRSLEQLVWQAQIILGMFHVTGMKHGYDACVSRGGLANIGEMFLQRGIHGPFVVVSDDNVGPLYAESVIEALHSAGFVTDSFTVPAGEAYKTVATVIDMWDSFTRSGIERSSTVIALGGGVIGDLAGFAAATYLRGVDWVCLPTSVLAMVDASLGGKTGADLPQGKNLIGAFHPPRLVYADLDVLSTLPEEEMRSGFAEVVKHGVIADPELYELCSQGWDGINSNLDQIIKRAMAVKIQVLQKDPFEKGLRAVLNFGHTLGHAIEKASDYAIRHGEAVSIGMVAATCLSEDLGIAEHGLTVSIKNTLSDMGLPTRIPPQITRDQIARAIVLDKKRDKGKVGLVLPIRIGKVRFGVQIDDIHRLIEAGEV